MKHWRTAGVLLGVLLVLSGIAYWDEQQSKEDEKAEKIKNKVVDLTQAEIGNILYRSNHTGEEVKIELVKDERGEWRIVTPIEARADAGQVQNFLKTLTEYKYTKRISGERERWPEYGLDKPARIVRLEGNEGTAASLHIGRKTPVGYSVYFKVDGSDDVFVGSQHLLTATAKALRDFRDKKPFSELKEADVTAVTYQRSKNDEIVLQKESGKYQMVAPLKVNADQDNVEDLMDALRVQRVEDFVDAPEAALVKAFSGESRFARVVWQTNQGVKSEVVFTEYDGEFWAARNPESLVFKVPASDKSKYDRDVLGLRDRRVFHFESANVVSVSIDGETFLRQENGEFKAEEQTQDANPIVLPSKARNLVQDLEFAKTDQFLGDAEVSGVLKKTPVHLVELLVAPEEDKTITQKVVMQVYKSEKHSGFFHVEVDGDKNHYLIESFVFEGLSTTGEMQDAQATNPGTEGIEPME